MSKKLNIIQAIKMPVGTEFKVNYNTSNSAMSNMILKESDGDKYLDWVDGDQLKVFDFLFNSATFIPIQQPVSFMEVVDSGKRCRVEYSNAPDGYWFLDDMLYWLGGENPCELCAEIIKNGKWYIEESEEE